MTLNPLQTALCGIVTVLNTPFTPDDHIDLDALTANVSGALEAGVSGFLVPAMASEVGKLTLDERLDMVRTVVQVVAGRVPVIGGASAPSQAERNDNAERLVGLGCDGVLVSLPYSDDAVYEVDVRQIAERTPFLMIQDWDFGGYGLPVPLITRLSQEIPAFQSLKVEVVPAGVKYSEVLAATRGNLHVAGGWAITQFIEALDRGVHSVMPTGMHAIYAAIYRHYMAGQRDEAQRLFYRLLPVLAFSNQHLDISIHFFKRLLYREGVYTTPHVRGPLLPFDAYHERIADDLIEVVLALTAEVREAARP